MQSAKTKITSIVQKYIKDFPEEFELFKDGMVMLRHKTDGEFALLDGSKDTRALYEMPETLSQMLILGLDEDEMLWLKSGGKNGHAGGHWFTRTFKAFAIPQKI